MSYENELADNLLSGQRRAISKAITMVENGTAEGAVLLKAIHSDLGKARVIGITGPPGAGKSTLVNALVVEFRKQGKRIGVIAVDPSSPISGGAVLGDRIRMGDYTADDNVFIRSLASRGHLGGLCQSAARVVDVMDAAGFDIIIVETVGAGQSEVEIADIAHTRIVVCPPGLGDDIQAIKAGILEIADIFVVNKGDSPLAERTERELLGMLALRPQTSWVPAVLRTVATTGVGVEKLTEVIATHANAEVVLNGGNKQRLLRIIASLAAEELRIQIMNQSIPEIESLCDSLKRGDLNYHEVALKAINLVSDLQK